MRHIAMHSQTGHEFALPRGWIVLGAALASWMLVAGMWAGLSQVFGLVSGVI